MPPRRCSPPTAAASRTRRPRSRSAPGSAATSTAIRRSAAPTIAAALDRSRALALARYRAGGPRARGRDRVEPLARPGLARSSTSRSRATSASCRCTRAEIRHLNAFEPYRRKLSFMWARIDEGEYRSPEELLADLGVIRRSLEAHGGERVAAGRLAALERRVELFGFHLAKLDVRLHADEVRAPTDRTREVFAAVAAARRRHGPRALDTVIVSATTTADDVLARARPDRRAGVDRAAVRDDRRPRSGTGDPA